MAPSSPVYSPLKEVDTFTDDGSMDLNDCTDTHRKHRRRFRDVFYLCAPVLVVALSSFTLGLLINIKTQGAHPAPWSSELAVLPSYATKFNGRFKHDSPSQFVGKPGPELDAEWLRFSGHPLMHGGAETLIAVTEEDIKRSNKTGEGDWFNSTVQLGEVNGGGYMGSLELFHQFHCLNILRMAVNSDYYEVTAPYPNGTYAPLMRQHLDHCVDIIRQIIACNADTTLISFHWVEGKPTPSPDLNTWHQCKDPEEVLAWARAKEVTVKMPIHKDNFPDRIEMPQAPSE